MGLNGSPRAVGVVIGALAVDCRRARRRVRVERAVSKGGQGRRSEGRREGEGRTPRHWAQGQARWRLTPREESGAGPGERGAEPPRDPAGGQARGGPNPPAIGQEGGRKGGRTPPRPGRRPGERGAEPLRDRQEARREGGRAPPRPGRRPGERGGESPRGGGVEGLRRLACGDRATSVFRAGRRIAEGYLRVPAGDGAGRCRDGASASNPCYSHASHRVLLAGSGLPSL